MRSLTEEQRRGVVRIFFGDRFFLFGGLAGCIGLCVALILSSVLDVSYWPKAFLTVVFWFCGSVVFSHFEMKRLRPKIADYVFIHFQQKSA
jgi:hypothetical protein